MPEESKSPISAAVPPKANPLGAHASTLKLKPVIRKPSAGVPGATVPSLKPPAPVAAKPAAPAAAKPAADNSLDVLKSVTQSLKSATAPIPQQAILHKTGIIADPSLTEAQKQASKARTSRISLSDALGVAPVKNEAAPMKTIRIKRPVGLGAVPAAPAAAAPAAAAPAAKPAEATVTQRKTLKVARPGTKLGVKKPTAAAPAAADAGEVADIPDLPTVTAAPVAAPAGDRVADVSSGLALTSLIFQIAACLVMGFLAYKLYFDTTVSPF